MNNKNRLSRHEWAEVFADITTPLFFVGLVFFGVNASQLELNNVSFDNLFDLGTHENLALTGFSLMIPHLVVMLLANSSRK